MVALSDAAVREIAKVLRKNVGSKALEQIVADLVEIQRRLTGVGLGW